uniref:Tetratricopeptide repeat protein n=1 Tax=Leptospirillum ferrodiazotrophum TaxID=412449 RepID=C6I0C7_9BACT|nr:MAG: hypothetical protein UBAL3_95680019 [Leptospirillum ferrodiazotrophum]
MSSNIPRIIHRIQRVMIPTLFPFFQPPLFLGLFLSLALLGACALAPAPPPPSPHPAPAMPPARSGTDLILEAISRQNFALATKRLKRMAPSHKKKILISLLRNAEEAEAIRSALAEISRPTAPSAGEALQRLYSLSPKSFRALFLPLAPPLQTKLLLTLIRGGQERLAIRTLRLLPPSARGQNSFLIAKAYARWARRREIQNRLFDALELSRQSLQLDPQNALARSVESRIERIRRKKILEGLLAYRHRHLRQAIILWKEAQSIDPSQSEPKKYILKAQAILEKIQSLDPSKK